MANGGHCPTVHYPVHLIERAVEEHYRTVRLTPKVRDEIWAQVRRDTDERAAIAELHACEIEDALDDALLMTKHLTRYARLQSLASGIVLLRRKDDVEATTGHKGAK